MQVKEIKNITKITRLIKNYPYGRFRKYRFLSPDIQDKYLIGRISDISRHSRNRIFVYYAAKGIKGFTVLKYLPWDSKIFSKDMWQVAYLAAEGSFSSALPIKSCLLKTILDFIGEKKGFHLSCKVDVSDLTSVHALESNGFRLMDTLTNWIFRPSMRTPLVKTKLEIRDFQKKDLKPLTALAAKSFSRNRFYLDPSLSNIKADKLYSQWVKNYCLDRSGASRVNVAEKNSGFAGFIVYRLNKELEKISGYKVIGRGLMAVDPKAKGSAVALIGSITRDVLAGYDCAELDCLINNFEVIRIYQKFNCEIVGAQHTFHYFPLC